MKTRRLYLGVAFVVAMFFCGCDRTPADVDYELLGKWMIDNKTDQNFEVVMDFVKFDDNDVEYVTHTLVATVVAKTISPISVSENPRPNENYYQRWASLGYYAFPGRQKIMNITFVFANGVRHTFEGEMIGCDVRNMENWVLSYPGKGKTDHLYNFTTYDYEQIMALYE